MRPQGGGTSDHSAADVAEAVSGDRLQTVTGIYEQPQSTGNVVATAEPSKVVGLRPLGSQAGRSVGRRCGKPSGCRPRLCIPICVPCPPRWCEGAPQGAREIRACPSILCAPARAGLRPSRSSVTKRRVAFLTVIGGSGVGNGAPSRSGLTHPVLPSSLQRPEPAGPEVTFPEAVSFVLAEGHHEWSQEQGECDLGTAWAGGGHHSCCPACGGRGWTGCRHPGTQGWKLALSWTRAGVQASREGAAPEREGIPEAACGPLGATHEPRVRPASGLGVGRRLEQR